MDVLTAHELFAQRTDRSALDCDVELNCPLGPSDAWPAGATAAVQLAGCLDNAATDADLDEGLEHFQYLFNDSIVTQEQWDDATYQVIMRVYAWCEQRQKAAAYGVSP
jgi:hypothetical protein